MLAALRRIDLCAAVDPGVDSRLTSADPFSCDVATTPNPVKITVVTSSPASRRAMSARTVADAKAYVTREPGLNCRVVLPVSFEIGVSVDALGTQPSSALCDPALRVATVLATALADPVQDEASWDACGAVRAAVAEREHEQVVPVAMDFCHFPDGSSQLRLRYETAPEYAERGAIGDTTVWIDEGEFAGERGCFVHWSLGSSRTSYASPDAELLASVSADTCPRAKELAETMVPVLAKPPPDDVTPQRPLLYGPDEPDLPGG
ncbi:hypothetical protein [Actinophytocola gossypii]|uniref:DUF3558 domain-containing protein n=1 Tax=Actinophytocola gossypii TaxID=2812003 RepID=A0ABT2JFX1_9PSEU|nr:hypothetical protein [Actinophytocola gossypii]MCT2586429.1 hypothetical protein [Actinophytocola gossypii]